MTDHSEFIHSRVWHVLKLCTRSVAPHYKLAGPLIDLSLALFSLSVKMWGNTSLYINFIYLFFAT